MYKSDVFILFFSLLCNFNLSANIFINYLSISYSFLFASSHKLVLKSLVFNILFYEDFYMFSKDKTCL